MPRVPTLCLTTVWSGPLPKYLNLFLLSAAANSDVDFLFVADSPRPDDLFESGVPANIRWVERSYPNLLRQFSDRLGLLLPLAPPYKACDYRPAFGVALADLLVDHEGRPCDFWGYLDCDTILGRLRDFASPSRLEAHDLLTFRGRGITHGPLTIFRNHPRANRLFEEAPDWRDTFMHPDYCAFDEGCRRWKRPPMTPAERAARGERVSFTDCAFSAASEGRIRLYDADHVSEVRPAGKVRLHLRCDAGTLTDLTSHKPLHSPEGMRIVPQQPRSLAYYHLLYAKNDSRFHLPAWRTLPHRFVVTGGGVRDADMPPVQRAAFALRHACRRTTRSATQLRHRLHVGRFLGPLRSAMRRLRSR